MNKATRIKKEAINCLNFPSNEVLETTEDKKIRNRVLNRASILGNIYRTKMHILFKDNEGLKRIHTTVWAVTDKYVILKGSSLIPLHRITKVY